MALFTARYWAGSRPEKACCAALGFQQPLEGCEVVSRFLTPAMVADAASYSASLGKPAQVLASWRPIGLPMNEVAMDGVE